MLPLLGSGSLWAEVARSWVAGRLILGAADAVEGRWTHAASALRRSDTAEVARVGSARSLVSWPTRAPVGRRAFDSLLVRTPQRTIRASLACAIDGCGLSAGAVLADGAG